MSLASDVDMVETGAKDTSEGYRSRWPLRLQALGRELESPADKSVRDALVAEAWVLLKAALLRYLRYHAAGLGRVADEDIEDVAAQKSFDLLCKMELGEWRFADRHPLEIKGFLSRVAKNGLLNLLKKRQRELSSGVELSLVAGRTDAAAALPDSSRPEDPVESQEFVKALRGCVERLNARSQLIWFLRVCCELSSKDIARHPEVGLKPGHVDVLLQRGRQSVRDCMEARGFEPRDMPPGTFTVLWQSILLERSRVVDGVSA